MNKIEEDNFKRLFHYLYEMIFNSKLLSDELEGSARSDDIVAIFNIMQRYAKETKIEDSLFIEFNSYAEYAGE